MHRAVIDTNVLVSAFLFHDRGGVPVKLLHRLAEGRFKLVLCRALLDELQNVLTRDATVAERYRYTTEMVSFYRATLEAQAELIEPKMPVVPISRDPNDDIVVATAVAASAGYIVTGDHDLLSIDRHEDVRIVTPRQFLDLL